MDDFFVLLTFQLTQRSEEISLEYRSQKWSGWWLGLLLGQKLFQQTRKNVKSIDRR